MKVYVVMGNDYPDRVYQDEQNAKDFCDKAMARQKEVERFTMKIYWRYYDFDVIVPT